MANFDQAHSKTSGNEGGWAHNPADKGGETYRGVAREFWPKWQGWQGIDAAKKRLLPTPPYGTREYRNWVAHFNDLLASAPLLQKYVDEFYEAIFWDAYRLGEIENQEVADWIYDHAVNAGARGIKWAQEAAGVKTDGVVGPATLKAINGAVPVNLLREMEDVAAFYRLDRAEDDATQIQFLPSWLRRDGVSKGEIAQVMEMAKGGLTYSEVVKLKGIIDETV